MPFHIHRIPGTFYRPGERKGNASIVWRGVVPGRDREVEIRTDATAESAAARHVQNYIDAEARRAPAPAGAALDLATAAQHYAATNNPSKADQARIAFIVALHGALDVATVSQAHVNQACAAFRAARAAAIEQAQAALAAWHALERKPRRPSGHLYAAPRVPAPPSTDTVNREVKTPYSAILHFAHGQGWRADIRVSSQKTPAGEAPRPPVRMAHDADVEGLLATPAIAAFPNRAAFILLLHERGPRIGDALRMRWEWQDLQHAIGRVFIKKPAPRWFTFQMSPELVAALANMGAKDAGPIFTWGSRSNVYAWLDVAEAECGIKWRPHESRRAVVTGILKQTGNVRQAQKYVDHKSEKTTWRYVHMLPSDLAPRAKIGRKG
jgi:integrase